MGEDALGGEQLQGLADGEAGDAEPLGQLLGCQVGAHRHPAANMVKDLRGETLGQLSLSVDRALAG